MVLALAAYYPAQLCGKPFPSLVGDASLYDYQLMRSAECHGQWWQIVKDTRLGYPYPTEFAKHPGLFEGVDLMLLAALTAGSSGTLGAYHLAVLLALLVNGWIAAWIVLRFTRSTLWAAMAVVLITLNQSVGVRILGHLHLIKFGWILLSVWAFVGFLERPTRRSGLFLGIVLALVLQSSFYFGYFMVLSLATWYLQQVLAGRVKRSQFATGRRRRLSLCHLGWCSLLSGRDRYFGDRRQRRLFSARMGGNVGVRLRALEVFRTKGNGGGQCLLARRAPANRVEADGRGVEFSGLHGAPWRNGRGRVSVAGGGELRKTWAVRQGGTGSRGALDDPQFGGRTVGAALFRRAELPVLRPIWIARGRIGLGHHSDRIVRVRPLGASPTDACGPDFGRAATCHQRRLRAAATFPGWRAQAAPPAWVEWLKGQPSQVRLAAFAMPEPEALSIDWWGGRAISWLPLHRHATLNGSDYALLEGDLRLLGGSYERINPAGLRFVASLGYDTLAFHRDYLKTNSWIEALPWLDRVDERDVWEIFRINKGFLRLPQTTLEQILARGNLEEEPATKIPPDCWITGSWPVAEDTYVADSEWGFANVD